MAYTVLARRYRSTTFDEVIGQDHVARTLKRAIESGRIAHAYLFCGTRGVGKTSMARILAKALNCEKFPSPTPTPCGECGSCKGIARGDDIDVIEIDAASNRGIDDVRNIIANAAYRPARARFKIYIIDEVHGLTKDAFNALLKVLEEPPEHVKFILATTEAEKILPTILSRCQRYDFRNIPTREIAGHLKEITKKEDLQADDDALLLVAKAGAGSMRDSLSLLDRLLSVGEKRLTIDMIEQLLGLPKAQLVFDLAQAIGEGSTGAVLKQADAIITGGMSVDSLIAALVDHLRNLLIIKTCGAESDLVEVPGVSAQDMSGQAARFDAVALSQDITILEELRRHIRQSQSGRALLDATLVRLALADQFASIGELLARLDGSGGGGGAPRAAPIRPPGNAGPASKTSPANSAPVPTQKKKTDELDDSPLAVQGSSLAAPAPPDPPISAVASTAAQSTASRSAPLTPPAVLTGAAPSVSAPPDISFDDPDEDDDLPRPGKVWDSGGPSLKELLASRSAAPAARSSAQGDQALSPEPSNVEPVASRDLPRIWQQLLADLASHGPMLNSVLAAGRLTGVNDGTAVVTFGPAQETFVKMMERNGKKDLVRDALTKVLSENVGIRFEVDAGTGTVPHAARAEVVPPRPRPAQALASRPPLPPEPAAPPPVKITPELIDLLRESEPLVKTLMDDMGATIIKVEGE